ncbi:MAG: ChbG/HpnK family deacetylase [Rubrivivax sp.]
MGLDAARAALGRSERELLRREITAQLDAFESALGRPPDFVDGHRHVHQLGGVREVLLEVLGERFGSRRPWLRNSRPRLVGLSLKSSAHRPRRRARPDQAAATGWRQNARLLGIYDFRGGLRRCKRSSRAGCTPPTTATS